VWHDEGAWVHNARNRALWGTWRTDEWNPMFIAPVFTFLEYVTFRELGVGTWQARVVPMASGLLAIAALTFGLAAVGGRRAAFIGATLLTTNYAFVMWNRAALMESTMTAFIVCAWAAYALGRTRPAWGLAAGASATLAWFSKAAAAFFVAALVLDALVTLALAWDARRSSGTVSSSESRIAAKAAWLTLGGLVASAALFLVFFVLPHWTEYRFYNWQMSVTRKPSYAIGALLDRASWVPLVHDFFTRMWLVLVAATLATIGIVTRWRSARPAERLLALWLLLGLLELVVHDSGNERRYVMLIPALVGLAALTLASPSSMARELVGHRRWAILPVVAFLAYLVIASLMRLALLSEVRSGQLQVAVRLSAPLATILSGVVVWKWQDIARWLSQQALPGTVVAVLVAVAVIGDVGQYVQWASRRTDLNYQASLAIGRVLPAGTLVHGKLANGLALDNRIRPIFVGRKFGNYADRTSRDDVRYVLTYVSPYVGYEGRVIRDVLDAYPRHTIVMTFPVAETAIAPDRVALIDKFGVSGIGSGTLPTSDSDSP
jgi:4-amino-4-deoxy-L-arabinose transferase-like glycosyltransferase